MNLEPTLKKITQILSAKTQAKIVVGTVIMHILSRFWLFDSWFFVNCCFSPFYILIGIAIIQQPELQSELKQLWLTIVSYMFLGGNRLWSVFSWIGALLLTFLIGVWAGICWIDALLLRPFKALNRLFFYGFITGVLTLILFVTSEAYFAPQLLSEQVDIIVSIPTQLPIVAAEVDVFATPISVHSPIDVLLFPSAAPASRPTLCPNICFEVFGTLPLVRSHTPIIVAFSGLKTDFQTAVILGLPMAEILESPSLPDGAAAHKVNVLEPGCYSYSIFTFDDSPSLSIKGQGKIYIKQSMNSAMQSFEVQRGGSSDWRLGGSEPSC